jgi:hypothetical protein
MVGGSYLFIYLKIYYVITKLNAVNFYRLNWNEKSSKKEKNICRIKTMKTTKKNMKKKGKIIMKRKSYVFEETRDQSSYM